jgi:ribose 5-phosphate isomerase A
MDLQNHMKQAVAQAAVDQIQNGMILGLGSGSTAALMIEALAVKIKSGSIKDIVGVTTSFQGEVLASELGIPLKSLSAVSEIDLAIDGADEVDPKFQLIKGGGACHVQEKLVAALAKKFIVVVDSSKLVEKLNLDFKLPVEVLPSAWKQVQKTLQENFEGEGNLRMAQKKAGPIVTDQGNLILDLTFRNGIDQPELLESQINNIPGVLENGLFVNMTDEVLVGKVENDAVGVESLSKI